MYQVCEYGYLLRIEGEFNAANSSLQSCALPAVFWDSLEDLVEDEDEDTRGVIYGAAPGPGKQRRLRIKNHIGVLATPEGSLEILPKLGHDGIATKEQLRSVVAHMLETVQDLPFRGIGEAAQGLHHDSLFEWFIAAFLQRVSKLVGRGLRSSYETLEDNLPVLRGRLLMQQHIRRNVADQTRLYVRFDEFTANRPENRLIHAALDKAWRHSNNTDSRRQARELMLSFAEVSKSTPGQYLDDFNAWRDERGASHYRDLKSWCHAMLTPYSPAPAQGEKVFDSFLFPAERLFEDYVAERLRQALQGSDIQFKKQVREKSLFKAREGPFGKSYQLRPDILMTRSDQTLICDTKWKLYEGPEAQISQADLYQMFVYASYWRENSKSVQLALITPASSALHEATGPHHYTFDKFRLELWILPYDLLKNHGNFLPSNFSREHSMGLLDEVLEKHSKKFSH